MQRRTTSHDVARLAGVSQSAVSLVLNGRADKRIPEATRRRVLEAAQTLNYTRNTSARALLTGRTHRVGVVPIHPRAFVQQGAYYGALMSSFIEGALEHGYNLVLHCAPHDDWEGLYSDILGGSTDGVILIGRNTDDALTRALLRAEFPAVCVSYQPDAPAFYSVDCDNEMGGYLAAQHLLESGHACIAHVQPHPRQSWERDRFNGAQRAIAEAGLPPDILRSVPWSQDLEAGVLLEWICGREDKTRGLALICQDESQGEYLIQNLPRHGLRVPGDLALVSYNSSEVSERTNPAQTSVWQPLGAIGRASVDMLTGLCEGREVEPGTRHFPMRLDVRGSSGA